MSIGFLIKWFAIGWVFSAAAIGLYVVFLWARTQRQAPDDVVSVSLSIGWMVLWSAVGAVLITLVAGLMRAWSST